jgi:effector-binding domain-containing protein
LALYLDSQGSLEVGAEVSEPFTGNDRVHCSKLPAGRAVTTAHFGPYVRLSDAHEAIREWCARHGHQFSGVSWEIYGHWEESWNTDSSKIRTDVFYLLHDPKS